jgi:predicted dehydrogenase
MDRMWDIHSGVFSRSPQINCNAASVYGVAQDRAYSTLRELVENERGTIDAIILLTPTPMHHAMVCECLKAGIPVICEKALATTSAEASEIEDCRTEHSGFLAVIYNYSGYPMIRELRRMVREGVLGRLIHFEAEMPQEGYIRTDKHGHRPTPQGWRMQDGIVPTLHLDLAVHLHELVHYLTGLKPLEVVADQASCGWFQVADNASCLCRYSDAMQGHFWFSKCAIGHRNGLRLRIYGSKASVEWLQMNPEELFVSYADGRREVFDRASDAQVSNQKRYERFKAGHPAGFVEALANIYMDIAQDLHCYKQGSPQTSGEIFGAPLAKEGLLLLEAMVRSWSSGRWERVDC